MNCPACLQRKIEELKSNNRFLDEMHDMFAARMHQVEKSERRLSARKVRIGLTGARLLRQEDALRAERSKITAQSVEMAHENADFKVGQCYIVTFGPNCGV